MATPREALRLLEAPGVAEQIARRHHLDLVVAFGSAVVAAGAGDATGVEPRDLDLAVRSTRSLAPLELLDDLYRVTGSEGVDLLDLRRAGPVARYEALEGGVLLHEGHPGAYAVAHMSAVAQYADTAGLRRAQLEALAR